MDSIDDKPNDDSDHSSLDRGRKVLRKYANTIPTIQTWFISIQDRDFSELSTRKKRLN